MWVWSSHFLQLTFQLTKDILVSSGEAANLANPSSTKSSVVPMKVVQPF